jgi:Rrf2 family protein
MLFTKSTAYTLQVLIELSKFKNPVDVTKLSEITSIPKPFLAKLLQTLSKKGYVKSFKGVNGGFLLEKKPEEINILALFKAVENKDTLVFCCVNDNPCCNVNRSKEDSFCKINPFFNFIEDKIVNILANLTLADIIRMSAVK